MASEETGASRDSALQMLNAKIAQIESYVKELTALKNGMVSLRKQLMEIDKFASDHNDKHGDSAPSIGVGSDAEWALWRIISQFRPSNHF